jgi:ferric-dicitrate binding protein FerR (iron transport regulator)
MSDTNQHIDDTDPVGSLIRRAGLRDPAPETTSRRVRNQVHAEWLSAVENRRRRRRSVAAVAAATILAVVLIVAGRQTQSPPTLMQEFAATVARITGQVMVNGSPIEGLQAQLHAGDTLTTSRIGGASLMFADGALRMDADTRVVFIDGQSLRLLQGGVYIDSGSGPKATPVQVLTEFGTATDVGTQFQVRLAADELQVNVREGLVNVEEQDRIVSAQAGEAIQINRDGQLIRTVVDSQDESWDWAEELAPEFTIDNRSLLEFLSWAAGETGRSLIFEDANAERSADREILRGSIAGMNPDEALEAVRHTIESSYQVLDDQIMIRAASN